MATNPKAVTVLTTLVVKHGIHLDDREDYGSILKANGITPVEAKKHLPAAIKRAKIRIAAKAKEFVPPPIELKWNPQPFPHEQAGKTFQMWVSSCGKYKVVETDTKDGKRFLSLTWKATFNGGIHDWIEKDPKMGGAYYPRFYKTLREALEVAAKHFRDACPENANAPDNGEEVLIAAGKLGMDVAPAAPVKAPKRVPPDYGHPKNFDANPKEAVHAILRELIGEMDWTKNAAEHDPREWDEIDWSDFRRVYEKHHGDPGNVTLKTVRQALGFEPLPKPGGLLEKLAKLRAAKAAAAKG
jgi:hypothetical protein